MSMFHCVCLTGARVATKLTDEERSAVERHLGHLVQLQRVPVKADCLKCINAEPVLEGKDWRKIKDFIYAKIQKQRLH